MCVGHLPREISSITADVIRKGAQITCKVAKELSRRRQNSHEGDREIPIDVTVRMNRNPNNEKRLEEYAQHVKLNYDDPRRSPLKSLTNSRANSLEETSAMMDNDGKIFCTCITEFYQYKGQCSGTNRTFARAMASCITSFLSAHEWATPTAQYN